MSQSPSTVEQFVLLSLYTSPCFDQRKTPLIKGAPKQFAPSSPSRSSNIRLCPSYQENPPLDLVDGGEGRGAEKAVQDEGVAGKVGKGGVLQQLGLTLVGGEAVLKWCRVGPFLSYRCPPERRRALVGPLSEQRPANHVRSRHNSHRHSPSLSLPLPSFFSPSSSLFLISCCVSHIAVVIK